MELEALEADLKNELALKDEEIEQSSQTPPVTTGTSKEELEAIAHRILNSLKLGTQSPGYKAARKALLAFIQQLTTDN